MGPGPVFRERSLTKWRRKSTTPCSAPGGGRATIHVKDVCYWLVGRCLFVFKDFLVQARYVFSAKDNYIRVKDL